MFSKKKCERCIECVWVFAIKYGEKTKKKMNIDEKTKKKMKIDEKKKKEMKIDEKIEIIFFSIKNFGVTYHRCYFAVESWCWIVPSRK